MITPTVHDTGPVTLPGLRDTLDRIAHQWRGEVVDRTRNGRDAAGRRLRRRKDGTPSILTDSGQMLRSLGVEHVDEHGFRVSLRGRRNRKVAALSHQTGRPWVGVSDDQIDAARQQVADALRERT